MLKHHRDEMAKDKEKYDDVVRETQGLRPDGGPVSGRCRFQSDEAKTCPSKACLGEAGYGESLCPDLSRYMSRRAEEDFDGTLSGINDCIAFLEAAT